MRAHVTAETILNGSAIIWASFFVSGNIGGRLGDGALDVTARNISGALNKAVFGVFMTPYKPE